MPELYYIVGVDFNSLKGKVILKLYNPETKTIKIHEDNSGYLSYFYTLGSIREIKDRFKNSISKIEVVSKFNALLEKNIDYIKVSGADPLTINGENRTSVSTTLTEENRLIYENRIKHTQSYIYDNNLETGMPYYFHEKYGLIPWIDEESENRVRDILKGSKFLSESEERRNMIKTWARFFEYNVPHVKRASIDIEVLPLGTIVPDPEIADRPVISTAMYTSDGRKIVFVLKRPELPKFNIEGIEECEIIYFDNEANMLTAIFSTMNQYHFIITFNGDEFDLPYLRQRAINLGISKSKIPIIKKKKITQYTHGIHIDLYKFFTINAIKIYAFKGKYQEDSLDAIGEALIGINKIKNNKPIGNLSYTELTTYNLKDAEITYKLTEFNSDVVIKLIWAITRVSRLTMEDASRLKVSGWIRSFMFYEHRKRNYIIPRKDELLSAKGGTSTTSMVKGKKYKGAIVVSPTVGIHFKTGVVDFQSLYPSIMKYHNLGYQTINCKHPECMDNTVAGTTHHVCKKYIAMESLLIGSLKDLRVYEYKGKEKQKDISIDLKAWYSVVEQIIKVIMNASYGVFGSDIFDLYCPPVAESVAAIARYDTQHVIDKAIELGIEVIYGDTDSVFLKNPTQEQLDALIKWALETLYMDLALDKKYRYVCLSLRKKNYFGVFEDEIKNGKLVKGEVDIKGLTGKKKHTPKIYKDTFNIIKGILKEVNTEQDFVIAKQNIKKTIKKTYDVFKRREWTNLSDLAFRVTLNEEISGYTKTIPQHVRVAKQLIENDGTTLKKGETVEFVKVIKHTESIRRKKIEKAILQQHGNFMNLDQEDAIFSKKDFESSKPLSLVLKEEVDVQKYIDTLKNIFSQVLDALNVDFNEVIGVTYLSSF